MSYSLDFLNKAFNCKFDTYSLGYIYSDISLLNSYYFDLILLILWLNNDKYNKNFKYFDTFKELIDKSVLDNNYWTKEKSLLKLEQYDIKKIGAGFEKINISSKIPVINELIIGDIYVGQQNETMIITKKYILETIDVYDDIKGNTAPYFYINLKSIEIMKEDKKSNYINKDFQFKIIESSEILYIPSATLEFKELIYINRYILNDLLKNLKDKIKTTDLFKKPISNIDIFDRYLNDFLSTIPSDITVCFTIKPLCKK